MTRAILIALVSSAACAQAPIAQLRHALEMPQPAARRAAADALAKREGTTVDEWVEALETFRVRRARGAGRHVVRAELWNGAALEETELHVYVPERAIESGDPAPLLHAAHGTGGDGFRQLGMWQRVADEVGMIVLAPSEGGPNGGYRFDVREREIARSAIRWAKHEFDVDSRRVYLTGVSRGGHMTWDLALRFPDLPAAIAPLVGGPRWNPNGQNNMRYLEHARGLPIRCLQGMQDDPAMLLNLEIAFDRLQELGADDARFVTFDDLGHSFRFDAVDWTEFWTRRRAARPDTVVRVVSNERETRAFWVDVVAFDRTRVHDRFSAGIPTALHDRLDDKGRRKWINRQAVKRSARIEAELVSRGKITVRHEHVTDYRLLLTADMLDKRGAVRVQTNGRSKKFEPNPDKRVLLREFFERIDRSFLPVAEVHVVQR